MMSSPHSPACWPRRPIIHFGSTRPRSRGSRGTFSPAAFATRTNSPALRCRAPSKGARAAPWLVFPAPGGPITHSSGRWGSPTWSAGRLPRTTTATVVVVDGLGHRPQGGIQSRLVDLHLAGALANEQRQDVTKVGGRRLHQAHFLALPHCELRGPCVLAGLPLNLEPLVVWRTMVLALRAIDHPVEEAGDLLQLSGGELDDDLVLPIVGARLLIKQLGCLDVDRRLIMAAGHAGFERQGCPPPVDLDRIPIHLAAVAVPGFIRLGLLARAPGLTNMAHGAVVVAARRRRLRPAGALGGHGPLDVSAVGGVRDVVGLAITLAECLDALVQVCRGIFTLACGVVQHRPAVWGCGQGL